MPRASARGGARSGSQGQQYPNRSDLAGPAPVTTAPGQPYGARAEQQAAQNAIPTGTPAQPSPQTPGAPPSSVPSAAPGGAPGPADLAAMMAAHNGPGEGLALGRPTERPNEPVTHGLPVGPGGGPEALQGVGAAARNGAVEQGTLRNLLTNIASSPGATSAIRDLAARAAGGAM